MRLQDRSAIRISAVASLGVGLFLAVGVSVLAATSPSHYAGWAPGRAAAVGALQSARTATAPSDVIATARAIASSSGGDAALAESSIEHLTGGGSDGTSEVYAFSPDNSAVCIAIRGRGAACPTAPEADAKGVLWMLSGGYVDPGGSSHADELAGIVADNVAALRLTSNRESRVLTIDDNAFIVRLDRPRDESAWSLTLEVSYSDGNSASIDLADPRPRPS